jgi:hypothetical protein
MNLGNLRKYAIRQQTKVRFPLGNGMECVVNEHGVAQVPALKGVPDFNLETELASAQTFHLEPVSLDSKAPVKVRTVKREELAALAAGGSAAEIHDHDDE